MNYSDIIHQPCVENVFLHKFHRYFDLVFHFVGIALNVILIHLVNKFSGDGAGPYKNVFRLTCTSDLIISICSVVFIPYDGDMIFISNGIFSKKWPAFDLFAVTAVSGIHVANSGYLPTQYVYRYLCLCSTPTMRKYAMWITIAVGSIFSVIGCIVAFMGIIPPNVEYQQRAVVRLVQCGWSCYDENDVQFTFGSYFFERDFLIYAGAVTVIISGGYSVIVVSEIMLMRQLNKFGSLTSDVNVKKMQKEFKTALTALAICPLIFVVAPAMYYVLTGFFRINTPASLSSFVTMMTSSIAVANPIVTIVTVRPYRRKVQEWINVLSRRQVFIIHPGRGAFSTVSASGVKPSLDSMKS